MKIALKIAAAMALVLPMTACEGSGDKDQFVDELVGTWQVKEYLVKGTTSSSSTAARQTYNNDHSVLVTKVDDTHVLIHTFTNVMEQSSPNTPPNSYGDDVVAEVDNEARTFTIPLHTVLAPSWDSWPANTDASKKYDTYLCPGQVDTFASNYDIQYPPQTIVENEIGLKQVIWNTSGADGVELKWYPTDTTNLPVEMNLVSVILARYKSDQHIESLAVLTNTVWTKI